MCRKGVVNVLLANIRTLVIKVTIFDFMLVPSCGAPKDGSEAEELGDQPTWVCVSISVLLYSGLVVLKGGHLEDGYWRLVRTREHILRARKRSSERTAIAFTRRTPTVFVSRGS